MLIIILVNTYLRECRITFRWLIRYNRNVKILHAAIDLIEDGLRFITLGQESIVNHFAKVFASVYLVTICRSVCQIKHRN